MIYDEPKFLPGGDRYMLIEFGDEMNLELNFTAQGLAGAFARERTKGVVGDRAVLRLHAGALRAAEISFADLRRETVRLTESLGPSDDLVLDSRLFCFPTVYLDPWTKECVEDYIAKIAKKTPDPEFIAELNGFVGCAAVCPRPLWNGVLGGGAGILARSALYDAAGPALQTDRAEIQSAAHLDSERHGGNGRRLHRHLPGAFAGRLSGFRAHSGSDLGHQAEFSGF